MTLAIDMTLEQKPTLSPEGGWQYHPSSLEGTFIKEGNRKIWKHEATHLMRRSTVCHRDPIAVALILDAILRMEHNHTLSAGELAAFMNHEYHQFTWNAQVVGRILNNLYEAALVPNVATKDRAITTGATRRAIHIYQVNTSPIAWRWLNQMRFAIGELAEKAIETDGESVTARKATFWDDFPWELAKLT